MARRMADGLRVAVWLLLALAVVAAFTRPAHSQSPTLTAPIPLRWVLTLDAATAPDSGAVAASLTRWQVLHQFLTPTVWVVFLADPAVTPTPAFDSVWAIPGRGRLDLDEFQKRQVEPVTTPAAPVWGISYTRAPEVWATGNTGEGVVIGIIDSGISPHPLLDIAGGRNFNGGDVNDWTDNIGACNGHGTHVAGTTAATTDYGVAKGARVYALKVFSDNNGSCGAWASSQIAAVLWAKDSGIRVLNASIGGSYNGGYNNAVADYAKWGGIFVGAAGNSGSAIVGCPGCYDYGTASGALNASGGKPTWSQYGTGLDFMTPGEGITSTMPNGGTGGKSGTSMSSPHLAGIAALVLTRRPDLSVYDFHELLRLTARNKPTEGRSAQQGFGHADAFAADSFLLANPGWRAPKPGFVPGTALVDRAGRIIAVDSAYTNTLIDPWGWAWTGPKPGWLLVTKDLGMPFLRLNFNFSVMTGAFPQTAKIVTTTP